MKYNPKIAQAYWASLAMPDSKAEYAFHPGRKWRFDFAWPEYSVALEVEGGVWTGGRHTRGAGFVKDLEKYNTAASDGWLVLRVQPKDLCMLETASLISKTLTLRRIQLRS